MKAKGSMAITNSYIFWPQGLDISANTTSIYGTDYYACLVLYCESKKQSKSLHSRP